MVEQGARKFVRAPGVLVASVALGVLPGCDGGASAVPPTLTRTEASEFSINSLHALQRHVRLPDDGEWRCAEEDGVAWCAGGEPAAGVVTAPAERGYVCGVRRGVRDGGIERVCVDESPDYPDGERGRSRCRFVQERGTQRECFDGATELRPVTSRTAPDCWIDEDCAPETCDRGRCTREAP